MQNATEWSKQYCDNETSKKVEERKALWSPELQERVSQDWARLFSDIEGLLHEDPAGEKAQALASRWKALVAEFTGGDRGIQQGLNKMYADRDSWPEQPKRKWAIKPEIQAFIMKLMKSNR